MEPMTSTFTRSCRAFLLASLPFALHATSAVADPSTPHRLSLAVSPWSQGTYDAVSDGYYSQKGVSAIAGRAGYRYGWLPSLEVGGVTSVAFVEGGRLWSWRIQPLVRTHLDIGDVEIGGSFQPGFHLARLPAYDLNFIGPILTIGVDAGVHVGDRLTLDVGADATIGWAKVLSSDRAGVPAYFANSVLTTLVLSPFIGATLRL